MLRGQRVLLDVDLAALYGVTVRLEINELQHTRMQFATASQRSRNLRFPPFAFVKLRQVLASNTELARKLAALEKSVATLDARTRRQFEAVYAAIRGLMAPAKAESRPIGFMADIEKK